MAITRARFSLALEQIKPSDWSFFEQLASTFLASEFPNIRTLATASGDGGRDAEIFCSRDEPSVAIQYSVTNNWASKIRATIDVIGKNFPEVHSLIYMTNQIIGAKADDLKKEIRKSKFDLDIRDGTWFLDRANSDRSREQAAEEAASRFVDPLLPSREIDRRLVAGLSNDEAKTALLFIEMQIQDSSKNYGLTKTSYEALTLAALRDTNTSSRMPRREIHQRVGSFLPSHAKDIVDARVDAALVRLSKSAVRHRKDNDEFHLRDEERLRVVDAAARVDGLRKISRKI